MTSPSPEEVKSKILASPEYYFRDILGVQYWSKMGEIAHSILNHRRTIVSGCTCSSKTFTVACCIFMWLALKGRPSRAITFAPTGRQVSMNLWGYMPVIYENAPAFSGGQMFEKKFVLAKDWFAMGFSADEPKNVTGIHGKNDLIVYDDGQGIGQPMYKGLELAMATGRAHAVILCNKDTLSGEVYDAFHSKRRLYNHIEIPAFETPNYIEGRDVIEGMISKSTVEEWRTTPGIGEGTDFFRVYVEDKFPSQEASSLIPVEWVQAALKREPKTHDKRLILGGDVARSGRDNSVCYPMRGLYVLPKKIVSKWDTMEVTGLFNTVFDDLNATAAFVDVIGIGAGVVDRMNETKHKCYGVNVSESIKPTNRLDIEEFKKYKFKNLRALVWWATRWSLDPRNPEAIRLPNDPELLEELTSVRFRIHSDKEIEIESKDETKVRLKRSPDNADALNLANYGRLKLKSEQSRRLVSVATVEMSELDDD